MLIIPLWAVVSSHNWEGPEKVISSLLLSLFQTPQLREINILAQLQTLAEGQRLLCRSPDLCSRTVTY